MLISMRAARLFMSTLIALALCCLLTKAKQQQQQQQPRQQQLLLQHTIQSIELSPQIQSSEVPSELLNYSIPLRWWQQTRLSRANVWDNKAKEAENEKIEENATRNGTVTLATTAKVTVGDSREHLTSRQQYRSNSNGHKRTEDGASPIGQLNDPIPRTSEAALAALANHSYSKVANRSRRHFSTANGPITSSAGSDGLIAEPSRNASRQLRRRARRQVGQTKTMTATGLSGTGSSGPAADEGCSKSPAIYGIRCDNGGDVSDGILVIKANEPTEVILIGRNLDTNISVALTPEDLSAQADCTHADRVKSVNFRNISSNIAQVVIDISASIEPKRPYYLCLRDVNGRWYHQGHAPWLKLYVKEDWLPVYMKIVVVAFLLMLSGLFSGLNLGLMALDKNELQVIISCGSDTEKRYARAIEPVRRRGNYLLCSILFSNVLVNSTIAVLLEELTSGIVAVMTSTIFIVMFGEILPQAFCSRHGLAVGAKTVSITYFCMIVTFPLSYPVSSCLDWALGEEIGHAYDRERLMEFIRVTRDYNNLETDEVNIISGALKLKRIPLSEVMTRIEDVYMLDLNSCLDFDTIQAIIERGYSRIPVHEPGNKKNIVALLFAKDLALLDPDNKTPVQTLISFYNHPIMYLFEDTTLDLALNEFKTGKSHMAFVRRVIDDGDRDPVYEITGIVTLEDVIEEIMQMEINDETDTLSDNKRKRRRKEAQVRRDFSQFTNNFGAGESSHLISQQLCLAAYQYLATTVEAFSKKYITDTVLKRLLLQRIYYKVRVDTNDDNDTSGGGGSSSLANCTSSDNVANSGGTSSTTTGASSKRDERRLYTAGEPADYFIMILEGRVNVVCGKENLAFAGGPFSYFGKAALIANPAEKLLDSPMITSVGSGSSCGVGGIDSQSHGQSNTLSLASGSVADLTARREQQQTALGGSNPVPRHRESLIELKKIGASQLAHKRTSEATSASGDQQEAGAISYSATGSPVVNFKGTPQATPRHDQIVGGVQSGAPSRIKSSASKTSLNSVDKVAAATSFIVPDYTVEIATDTSYLKITRQEYLAALKASQVERGSGMTIVDNEEEEEEAENRDEDDNSYASQSTSLLAKHTTSGSSKLTKREK